MADDQRSRASPAALYDEDFYEWTQQQAAAIRAAAADRAFPPTIDWEHVAEEVGDMGKRDLRECWSRVMQILIHLWKLRTSARAEPRNHWISEILDQRSELSLVLTPTLRRLVEERLEQLHADAARRAAKALEREESGAPAIDSSLRWTLPQILGEEDDPLG